jgi:transcriptional regulator with XRE-family HTH domain
MITNERQLQVARAEIERFEAALNGGLAEADIEPTILKAQRDALEAQLGELRGDVAAYLKLRKGDVRTFKLDSLANLPEVLISARIASGMTQRELAERLSLKEQQIQRYETQNYAGASFARIVDIADAIGVGVPQHLVLAEAGSKDAVLKRAAVAGIDPQFVRRRIAPSSDPHDVAARLAYVFDWSPGALLSASPLELPATGGATARFKMPKGRSARAVAAYSAYAYRLAQICARAMPVHPPWPIPIDARPMIDLIRRRGTVNFPNALESAWDLGVIVLPLADAGQFHGACWRIAGTNVVVLKQNDRSSARWLIDLLHEVFHAGRFSELSDFEVVEEPETSDARRKDREEQQATWFASLVATDGRAEELFKAAVDETHSDLRRLKATVARVAKTAGVDASVLANYAAYRLSMQGEDWWGTAANLQDRSLDPLEVAREAFFQRFDFSGLDQIGLEVLTLALHDEVENG